MGILPAYGGKEEMGDWWREGKKGVEGEMGEVWGGLGRTGLD